MASTLYLEGNFLPDFWLKPNLFYQKLALCKSKVLLISDSIAPDLKAWLKEKNPNLDYQYLDSEGAQAFLDAEHNLTALQHIQLFIEDRNGSLPKDIYRVALNAGPPQAFVLARWIDWVGSSKSTLTAAFMSLSVTKSVINHPSELYQFVDLFPESEALVLKGQHALSLVPMGAYYIFNKGSTKIQPFSIYDSNQRQTLDNLEVTEEAREPSPDFTDLFLALRKIEELLEGREEEKESKSPLLQETVSQELSALKQLLSRHLSLEYGLELSQAVQEPSISFKGVTELIHGPKEVQALPLQESLDGEELPEQEKQTSKQEQVEMPEADVAFGAPPPLAENEEENFSFPELWGKAP